MVRPCNEDERGAHSEISARCGHAMENKKRSTKQGGTMPVGPAA